MKTVKTFKGLTGANLLDLVKDDGVAVNINGENAILTPCTLPFSNRGEISTIEEATHVAVRTRFMDYDILVKV